MSRDKKFFILFLAVVFILDIILSVCTMGKYPQLRIDRRGLIGAEGKNLKDFSVGTDGNLISGSSDPYVMYELADPINIKTVEIDVDSFGQKRLWSQLFLVPDGNGVGGYKSYVIQNGKNIITSDKGDEWNHITGIRFDFVNSKNVSIKVDNVVINNRWGVTVKYHILCLLIVLIVCLVKMHKKIVQFWKSDISSGITILCALAFLLCIFAPLDLYFNNLTEFWFDVYDLLPYTVLAFIIFVFISCISMLTLFLINRKIFGVGVFILFCLYISTYIQGNYLTNYLPPLDGTEFIWEDYSSGRIQTYVLWCVVVLISGVLYRVLRGDKFRCMAKYIAGGMMVMLALTLGIESVTTYGYQNKLNVNVTTKNQFEMSSEGKNFIILMLDALDSYKFNSIVCDNDQYKKVFSDFTYYPDAMAAYPYTSRSVPFVLAGEWFENKELFSRYNERVYKEGKLFTNLAKENYKMCIFESGIPLTDKSIFRFDNIVEKKVTIKNNMDFMQLETKLVGFKYAPFDLKKNFFAYAHEFNLMKQDIKNEDYQLFDWQDISFYENMNNSTITTVSDNCFKFIHLEGAHVPYQYDKELNIIDEGTYEQKIEACITVAQAYLEMLKTNNVYDNSVIIIMADHGFGGARQNPLFMVKGINEHHEMQTLNVPISYEDLQMVYEGLLSDKKGNEIFNWEEGVKRERRFLSYWFTNEDYMEEYIQTGKAWDTSTMIATGRQFNRR